MINADTFMTVNRWLLASAPALPEGWIRSKPHRIGCAFDFVCSRWMDELVIAGCTPLRVKISAVDVLFFLETTQNSGSYQVRIDGGEPTCYSAKCRSGNMPLAEIIAIGLSPDCEHDLEITPVLAAGEEFRLESICVSGGAALISGPLL